MNKMPENISSVGLGLIKKFEGCHEVMSDGSVHAYRDPVGIWTIGWGHTKGVKAGQVITQEQADAFFLEDVSDAVAAVRKYIKVPLTQNQFDALVSFTYNLGSGNLRGSTLLRLLNQGDYDAVPTQLNRWNKGLVKGKLVPLRGLTRRRSAEAAMFAMDEPFAADGGAAMVQKPRAGEPDVKPLKKSRTIWGSVAALVGTLATGILSSAGELAGTFNVVSDELSSYATEGYLMYVTLGLSMAGAMLAAYARWDDHQKAIK